MQGEDERGASKRGSIAQPAVSREILLDAADPGALAVYEALHALLCRLDSALDDLAHLRAGAASGCTLCACCLSNARAWAPGGSGLGAIPLRQSSFLCGLEPVP